ncbi:uncharacterized protein PHACADRAFT_261855 [Phanerochaete carnosa HHB-10118-sp]|uniref:AAA+ ATPase domain-containing protein n=1 Tax=Phanerochaete carnosa (strain HHB-10118-sp) TaxID=650164 RepID=K5VXQ3_PHACS|nr:uncharacterized protein PHACADRAFT_261855 [Phanerochaete carnosa HHB-10118-sp]EKM51610.1 hypothetical protein PHACADRAFT_261855 [Phanerochaete carnosa HHB-10118-sp]
MTFLDGLGSLPQLSSYSPATLERLKADATAKLQKFAPISPGDSDQTLDHDPSRVQLGSFTIPKGMMDVSPDQFSFEAPTTRDNINRVARACQLGKPILLEGSPGVGKTSLVAALANVCGHHLCRINLSDQTDLIDLFGSDLPVEGGSPGQFAWKDAEFLRALQEGHWVLLDEMNLAPQAVLEGLNAILDHRGTASIPELGRSFKRHPSFRIFAAQNPLHQGGGRKGLPKSFLNRFTKVYVQELSGDDVQLVCRHLFPTIPEAWMHGMITYITRLQEEVTLKRSFGREGAPWEFNLRDVIRWASQIQQPEQGFVHPAHFINTLFLQRFRTRGDRHVALQLFRSIFSEVDFNMMEPPYLTVSPAFVKTGRFINQRSGSLLDRPSGVVLQSQLSALESLGACLANNWLSVLTGSRRSGKSSLVRMIANLTGNKLHEISVNNATDASDILGSFEEVDSRVRIQKLVQTALHYFNETASTSDGSRLLTASHLHHSVTTLSSSLEQDLQVADVLSAIAYVRDALLRITDAQLPKKAEIMRTLEAIVTTSRDGLGRFEWVDGPLVQALKDGSWVLVDGANLCSPSVLDRLNSLCEIRGQLTLNERGAINGEVESITPHPNFRLFMCVDSQFGELSRAMRNRGVEISLLPVDKDEDWTRLLDHWSLPTDYLASLDMLPTLPFKFDAVRRGILIDDTPPKRHSTPSGSMVGTDSASSSMLDLVPSLQSPSELDTNRRALALFAVQSTTLSHLAVVIRLLRETIRNFPQLDPVSSTVESVLTSRLPSLLHHVRECISISRSVPLEVLLAQVCDL